MANILWSIIWLIILIIVGFWVAFFCAGWYVLVYPLTICIPDVAVISDFLLKGAQFAHYCAKNMVEGNGLF